MQRQSPLLPRPFARKFSKTSRVSLITCNSIPYPRNPVKNFFCCNCNSLATKRHKKILVKFITTKTPRTQRIQLTILEMLPFFFLVFFVALWFILFFVPFAHFCGLFLEDFSRLNIYKIGELLRLSRGCCNEAPSQLNHHQHSF